MEGRSVGVGFYGKLPTHGDFLRRRVSDAFVSVWDAWLQECLVASHVALGEDWLDTYLTSPVWRFCCAAGACGPVAVAGVLGPSVDRVGRYFPITIVAELPATLDPVTATVAAEPFFDAAERLLLQTLAADPIDFDRFDTAILALALELESAGENLPLAVAAQAEAVLGSDPSVRWQVPFGSTQQLRTILQQLAAQRLLALYRPLVLWWTEGSSVVEPSCLLARGLPPAATFPPFLDGAWADRGWRAVPVDVKIPPAPAPGRPDDDGPAYFRSAVATHIGRVRTTNEDALLERPELGLWAVADGMGGHDHGAVASRLVCQGLADVSPAGSLDGAIEAVTERLRAVNSYLRRGVDHAPYPVNGGSTVVVLLTRGRHAAAIWAGDSRAYHWRHGRLRQVTQDHSVAADGVSQDESHEVTRAVGADSTLVLDVRRESVKPGDRFLLCSDGLTRVLSVERMEAAMAESEIKRAVDTLVSASLDRGAPDNVTIIIVEVTGGSDVGASNG